MLNVVNGKTVGFGNGLYIGRANAKHGLKASILRNPFAIGPDGSRDDVIKLYREYLWECIKKKNVVYDALIKLAHVEHDLNLVCYCKPYACHGDVIVKAVEWIKQQNFEERVRAGVPCQLQTILGVTLRDSVKGEAQ